MSRITRINTLGLVAVLVPVLAASQASQTSQPAERSRTQGLKETDKFVKSGAGISDKVGAAKAQASTTLDAYNALVTQPSKDMKGDYKRLMKARDSMNSKVAEHFQSSGIRHRRFTAFALLI